MTRDEVKNLFKRIKSNYSTFVADEYKLTEWCKELKDYDETDVHKKLEEHMRSSEYGNSEPKLYFLTKYLKTTSEKNKIEKYLMQCSICKEFIPEEQYDKHYERCLDVEYIIKKRKELFDNDTSEELKNAYLNMDQTTFDNKYLEFLDKIYNYVSDEEKQRIEFIINPPSVDK